MFLVKLGSYPKGLVASGFITKAPFYAAHWKDPQQQTLFVEAELDCLFDPATEAILGLDILSTGNLAAQRWTPQSSGVAIKPNVVDELEAVWYDFLSTTKRSPAGFFAQGPQPANSFMEGSPSQITLTRYERNPYARKVCLQQYGYACAVCQFNFEKAYGSLGKEFIHVHHLNQLAHIGQAYSIDPITDLRPVCPNCHAMLHRTKAGLSIEELRARLRVTVTYNKLSEHGGE